MNRNSFLSLSILASTVFASHVSAEPLQGMAHYRVTVQNLMAANLLSPYISLVHKPSSNLFETGSVATAGLQQLAETGGTTILQEELAQNPIVLSVIKAQGSPLAAAEKRTIEIDVPLKDVNAGARFTILAMIGKSNDSFVAFKNLELKNISKGQYFKVRATNYDAGTEENTGNVEDLNATNHPTEHAEGHISFDRGLNQRGNAPEWLGWGSNAADVVIERTN